MDEATAALARPLLEKCRAIADGAASENRELNETEQKEFTATYDQYVAVKEKAAANSSMAEVTAALKSLGEDIGLKATPDAPKSTPGTGIVHAAKGSLGQTFVDSPEYKAFLAGFKGRAPLDHESIKMGRVDYKALVTGASPTSGGVFVQPDVQADFERLGRRPLVVRSAISVRQTESDTVEFVREVTAVNAAEVVPEATSSAVIGTGAGQVTAAAGGLKPEGSLSYEKETAVVKTLAVWVAATRRSLADASQLRGLIDQQLREDLAEKEEDQIVNGNGTGENFTGILNTSGIQAQAYTTDLFATARMGRTKVRTVGRSQPNAYMMNPEDIERVDLARGSDGHFIGAGPFGGPNGTLWGLPIIETEALPAGTGLVGDFRKAVLWDREAANISITDSHLDFFTRNLVAILGEERMAFGVTRPQAFVELDLTA